MRRSELSVSCLVLRNDKKLEVRLLLLYIKMKFLGVEIPNSILKEIRENNLVVFAGAGVSIPKPSRLPNFNKLVSLVAEGTDYRQISNENIVQFLGRLEEKGVKIRTRVERHLSKNLDGEIPKPSSLHFDILKLFQDVNSVRIVTTNFDHLIEEASQEYYKACPDIFRGPALPLGKRFRGIVHLHGSLDEVSELTLTDIDFGKAYLTEGWASRFLIDLHQNFSVLFIGYGYNDPIVDYLTRALPHNNHVDRFALIGNGKSANPNRWQSLGIIPILYPVHGKSHSALAEIMTFIAKHAQNSIVGWQSELERILSKAPTQIEEDLAVVDFALSDIVKTRVLVSVVPHLEWIDWFDNKGYFVNLFSDADLTDFDDEFLKWLIKTFTNCPERIVKLISKYQYKLNRQLWFELVRSTLSLDGTGDNKISSLGDWLVLLLKTLPEHPNYHEMSMLISLGKVCSQEKNFTCLIEVLAVFTKFDLGFQRKDFSKGLYQSESHFDYSIDQFWIDHIHPHISSLSNELVYLSFNYLYEHHRFFEISMEPSNSLYRASFFRRAIEEHEQNLSKGKIDAFIDICRESIQQMVLHESEAIEPWCRLMISANSPLLRRLGIYAVAKMTHIRPNRRIAWILDNVDIHDFLLHHELFVTIKSLYPELSIHSRKKVIKSINLYQNVENQKVAAYVKFTWFDWLIGAAPSCILVRRELEKIKKKFPDFESRPHPEFNFYISREFAPHNDLYLIRLETEPVEKLLDEMFPDENSRLNITDSKEILMTLKQRFSNDVLESFKWASGLIARQISDAGIWETLIDVWIQKKFKGTELETALEYLDRELIHHIAPLKVATFLSELDTQEIYHDVNNMSKARNIARKLWNSLDQDKENFLATGPFVAARNHPGGMISQFWINQIFVFYRCEKDKTDRLNDYFRSVLSDIVQNRTKSGTYARSILAFNLANLITVDEYWTRSELVPYFTDSGNSNDFLAMWDGFLFHEHIGNQNVFECLKQPLLNAVTDFESKFSDPHLRRKFVKLYVCAMLSFVDDPLKTWIPNFFDNSDTDSREHFAFSVGGYLSGSPDHQKRELWNAWLRQYWTNRVEGAPKPLDDSEVGAMLSWVPHLPSEIPAVIDIALQMEPKGSINCRLFCEFKDSSLVKDYPGNIIQLLQFLHHIPRNSAEWFYAAEVVKYLFEQDLPDNQVDELKKICAELNLN